MENNIVGFSTDYCRVPTNKNIVITYTPAEDVISYEYQLYKDNSIVRTVMIESNKSTKIYLDKSGEYKVIVNKTLNGGSTSRETSCNYIVDKEKPILMLNEETFTIIEGEKFDVLNGVTATDNVDGNLTSSILTNVDKLNFNTVGKKQLTYTVSDRAGNSVSKSMYINVVEDPLGLLVFQGILIILFMFCAAYILRYRRSLSLEKRIEKFSINPLIDTRLSLFDNILNFFNKLATNIKPTLEKSVFLTKYSKRYEKYIGTIGYDFKTGIDFVAVKFVLAIISLFIAACAKAIHLDLIGLYEIWIPLLAGFFLPDLLFISKYKIYRKKLENDLLQAIVIMNNAFKSGRSITQAVFLVTTELKGPIAVEFNKMYTELNLGLGVEEVFGRLSSRINLEEVAYLTASLSIINKTGGNIIRVFDSIEKTLVSKKKLRLELSSLTGGSKIIVNILFFVPLIFIIFVAAISPDYFVPLFTNPLGILLLIFMIVYYIMYIVFVKWIMKVRM